MAHNSSLNKFLVVWADIRGAGYGNDIYARAVNADGSLFGLEFTISTAAMSQSDPAVAYNPSTNQFLAVWHDSRLSPGTSPTVVGIYGRLVNLPSVDGPEFAISTYERCLRPALAYNSSTNQFLVVWEGGSNGNICGRLVNADGSMAGPDFAISTPADSQWNVAVAYNSSTNQFLVVWQDNRFGQYDIYARLVNGDGSMAGPEFGIYTRRDDQRDTAVAYNPTNNQFLVVWEHHYGSDSIYARVVNADGSMAGPEFDVNLSSRDQRVPALAYNPTNNQFLVVYTWSVCRWEHDCNDPEDFQRDIYGALYSETAAPTPTSTPTTPIPMAYSVYLPLVLRDYSPSLSPSLTPTHTPTSTPTHTPTPTPHWVTIMSEDFEGTWPGSWTLSEGGVGDYKWNKRDCQAYGGSYSGWGVGGGTDGGSLECGANYPHQASSWMVYGPFSLADATAGDLCFKLWLKTEIDCDFVCNYASINGSDFYGLCTSGDSSGWIDSVLDLSDVQTLGNLMGQPQVWVALRFLSDEYLNYPEGGYVDDIVLRKYVGSLGVAAPAVGGVEPIPDDAQIVEMPAMFVLKP